LHQPVRPGGFESQLMAPPRTIRSAPSSNIGSPNVSPPHQYIPHLSHGGSSVPYHPPPTNFSFTSGPVWPSTSHPTTNFAQATLNVDLVSNAASQIESGRKQRALTPPYISRLHYLSNKHASNRLPGTSLAQYSMSTHPTSRSHSHEPDDHYGHRHTKKSRPNSPYSTAPPSPTFSVDSLSPTPDHTPIITPAHSPRLRPIGWSEVQLPQLRSLSIHHAPILPPMEPNAETTSVQMSRQSSASFTSGNIRISDILSTADAGHRKLPVPKLAVTDLLNGPTVIGAETSAGSSIAGD